MAISPMERLRYRRRRNQSLRYTARREVRERIFTRDRYCCVACGAKNDLTIDHIISVYRGGTDSDDNLQTLCNRCNAGKVT